jgi:hypothetical protein
MKVRVHEWFFLLVVAVSTVLLWPVAAIIRRLTKRPYLMR